MRSVFLLLLVLHHLLHALLLRVFSVDQIFDGEDVYDNSTTTKKEFVQFIEGLTNTQFEKIQKFFESTPRLEHTFTVTNPETGVESEFLINGLTNFFG